MSTHEGDYEVIYTCRVRRIMIFDGVPELSAAGDCSYCPEGIRIAYEHGMRDLISSRWFPRRPACERRDGYRTCFF